MKSLLSREFDQKEVKKTGAKVGSEENTSKTEGMGGVMFL